jgi:SAM-dependent methyltransferase
MILVYCPIMSEASGFTVQPAEQFSHTEAKDAKRYWSSLPVPDFYKKPQTHWSDFMAEQVLRLSPGSVLEFGCNVGRNLVALRDLAPSIILKGIDINAEAVAFGRQERGLDLLQADETFFQTQADNSFDVIFTVSVLDHLPNPKPILVQMVRVARCGVLLLEPSLGEQGKVIKAPDAPVENPTGTTPFSYSWDYAALAGDLPVECSKTHYPLSGTLLGPYYWLFRLLKRPANQSCS